MGFKNEIRQVGQVAGDVFKNKIAPVLTTAAIVATGTGCIGKDATPTPGPVVRPPAITDTMPNPEKNASNIAADEKGKPHYSKTLNFRIDPTPDLRINDNDGIDNKTNYPIKYVNFIKPRQEGDPSAYEYVISVSRSFTNLPGGDSPEEIKQNPLNKAEEVFGPEFMTADGHKIYAIHSSSDFMDLFIEDANTATLWRIRYQAKDSESFNKHLQELKRIASTFQITGK